MVPTMTQSPTIGYRDGATGAATTARLSKNWFITQASGTTTQRLRLEYTDWEGKTQNAWLLGTPTAGYKFVTFSRGASSTLDPETCIGDGDMRRQRRPRVPWQRREELLGEGERPFCCNRRGKVLADQTRGGQPAVIQRERVFVHRRRRADHLPVALPERGMQLRHRRVHGARSERRHSTRSFLRGPGLGRVNHAFVDTGRHIPGRAHGDRLPWHQGQQGISCDRRKRTAHAGGRWRMHPGPRRDSVLLL